MKTVISNDPAPIGERWFKTGKFRMHTACRDLSIFARISRPRIDDD